MTDVLYRGVFKLIEEMGELQTVLGKLCIVPQGKHWDERYNDKSLRQRLLEEVSDVAAALMYFQNSAFSMDEVSEIDNRIVKKINRFNDWNLSGIPSEGLK